MKQITSVSIKDGSHLFKMSNHAEELMLDQIIENNKNKVKEDSQK